MSGAAAQAPAPRLRPAAARAHSRDGGIAATEAFSRGHAIDRDWMGWGALRVLSRQDWAPGAVRDEGRVANMERLLLVLDGTLEADCGGLGCHRAGAGDTLWIGAGHGLECRLANASRDRPLRLLELWLQPDRVNAAPAVAAWPSDRAAGGALPHLRQRAAMTLATVAPGAALAIPGDDGGPRRYWLEVLEGQACATAATAAGGPPGAGTRLAAGDGLAWLADTAAAPAVLVAGDAPARLLLLALPA